MKRGVNVRHLGMVILKIVCTSFRLLVSKKFVCKRVFHLFSDEWFCERNGSIHFWGHSLNFPHIGTSPHNGELHKQIDRFWPYSFDKWQTNTKMKKQCFTLSCYQFVSCCRKCVREQPFSGAYTCFRLKNRLQVKISTKELNERFYISFNSLVSLSGSVQRRNTQRKRWRRWGHWNPVMRAKDQLMFSRT